MLLDLGGGEFIDVDQIERIKDYAAVPDVFWSRDVRDYERTRIAVWMRNREEPVELYDDRAKVLRAWLDQFKSQ